MMTQAAYMRKARGWRWWLIRGGATFFLLIVVLAMALIIALKVGVSSAFLATKIQESLNARLLDKGQIVIERADLLLDDRFHLVLESRDLALNLKTDGPQIDKMGRIRIAVAALPLLQGKLHVNEVQLSDIDVTLPDRQGHNFLQRLPQDGLGRVDFDALSFLIFTALGQGLDVLERQALDKISLEQIHVDFPFRGKRKQLALTRLILKRTEGQTQGQTEGQTEGAFTLDGAMQFEGEEIRVEGNGRRDRASDGTMMSVKITQIPLSLGSEEDTGPYWEDGTVRNGYFRLKGLSDLQLTGQKRGQEQSIILEAHLPQGEVDLADVSGLPAHAKLRIEHHFGQAGLWIADTQLAVDRVSVNIAGHFAPLERPDPFLSSQRGDLLSDSEIIAILADVADSEGKYVFALTLDEGRILHPTIPALHFKGQVNGTLETLTRKVTFDSVTFDANDVNIKGQGSLRFAPPDAGRLLIGSQTPETIFTLQTPYISADEIKQIWPFNIASGVRGWFLRQISTGSLQQGSLHLNLPLDFYHKGRARQPLDENMLKISGVLDHVTANLVGDLPPVERFGGLLDIRGQEVALRQGSGEIFLERFPKSGNRFSDKKRGETQELESFVEPSETKTALDKDRQPQAALQLEEVMVDITRSGEMSPSADIRFQIKGEGADMLRLIRRDPIRAGDKLPFSPADFSGQLQAMMRLQFPLPEGGEEKISPDQIDWQGVIDFDDVALTLPLETGGKITAAQGRVEIDRQKFSLAAQASLDEMAATITMSGATQKATEREEAISLILDDATRDKLFPALSPFISGTAHINIGPERDAGRVFHVDLSQAVVEVPWLGWKKGAGIAAQAQFTAFIDKKNSKNITLKDFDLQGATFQLAGAIDIRDGILAAARFDKANLNRGDDMSLSLRSEGGRYLIKAEGKKFDMRSFIKSAALTGANSPGRGEAVTLDLDIARVSGFYDEVFEHLKASFKRSSRGDEEVSLSARSLKGGALKASLRRQGGEGVLHVTSGDGGAVLRFSDYYDKVQGGALELELQLDENAVWHGPLTLRNFEIVDEPRLARIVANPPANGGKSLNDVAGGKINAARLSFDRAFGQIVRGENFLMLDRGIVRGPTVGATFQGVVYDSAGNISMTGTFMPAYGLNRIFSNVPVLGNILGNGRDRGLIGLTFKIDGQAKNPRIIVNPLSVIAPGVFRQIFEFHQ